MPKTVIQSIWDSLLSREPYVSASPSVRFPWSAPQASRADVNPYVNNQPWYQGSNFSDADLSSSEIPDPRYT
jgi:hypothetical protein